MRSGVESWMLTYLLNSLWQVPLVLAAGWIAARALRPLGAAAEHRVWVGALWLGSALPGLSTLPWERVLARLAWMGSAGSGAGSVTVVTGPGSPLGGLHVPFDLLAAVALGYGIVTAWFALRFVWRCVLLRSIREGSVAVRLTGEDAVRWARCAERFGMEGVTLGAAPRIFGPVTLGLRRKVILLPAGMLAASVEHAEMETVLAHEFAHIRRHDFAKNLLYEVMALPVSYHPALWLMRARLTESREMVCDEMAARFAGRRQYARSLVRLAAALTGGVQPVPTPYAVGIFDTNTLERRLMQLTEKRNHLRGWRRAAILSACAALGLATCGSALALRMHVNGATAADNKAPAQPAGPIEVRSGIMAGQRIGGPMPKYPEAAKKAKIQGTVVLDAVIGRKGDIIHLTAQSGPIELRKSSLDAVSQWTYKPYLLNGEPVAVKTTINVIYSLQK